MRTESVNTYRSVFKTVSKHEADAYYDLAVDLQLAGRHEEAIISAQDALSQYRTLALQDPKTFTLKVARGLSLLANILLAAKKYGEAMNEGHEALKIFESLIKEDPAAIPSYLYCLKINKYASFHCENDVHAIERSTNVVQHFRELIVDYPADVGWGLAEAFENHGLVLIKHKQLAEANQFSKEVEKWYENLPVNNAEAAEKYMVCLINHGSNLNNAGRAQEALVPMEKAVAVGMQFYEGHSMVTSFTASLLLRHAFILYKLGRYPEALKACKETVSFGRQNPIQDDTEFAGCLVILTLCLIQNGEVQEALKAAKEAVEICRNAPMDKILKKNMFSVLQLPHSLQMLSESHADCGDEDKALLYAQEALDAVLALKKPDCTLPWSLAEGAYLDTMDNLAICLLAAGNLDCSLSILLEVEVLLLERTKMRKGVYTAYATLLRTLAICYCAQGKHKEGLQAKEKLQHISDQLEDTPGLIEIVEIQLRKERKRPSWLAIRAKLGLTCVHQHNS
ncbi:hypothetical protein B0H34DRAFT_799610 [Crassisporium funariophilum]|nr:hypothetical protein B0H34DRAFT_799610 [Crassisporium funariophilum]